MKTDASTDVGVILGDPKYPFSDFCLKRFKRLKERLR